MNLARLAACAKIFSCSRHPSCQIGRQIGNPEKRADQSSGLSFVAIGSFTGLSSQENRITGRCYVDKAQPTNRTSWGKLAKPHCDCAYRANKTKRCKSCSFRGQNTQTYNLRPLFTGLSSQENRITGRCYVDKAQPTNRTSWGKLAKPHCDCAYRANKTKRCKSCSFRGQNTQTYNLRPLFFGCRPQQLLFRSLFDVVAEPSHDGRGLGSVVHARVVGLRRVSPHVERNSR